jgi:hypothetical protein
MEFPSHWRPGLPIPEDIDALSPDKNTSEQCLLVLCDDMVGIEYYHITWIMDMDAVLGWGQTI